jgi:hypothetical protein
VAYRRERRGKRLMTDRPSPRSLVPDHRRRRERCRRYRRRARRSKTTARSRIGTGRSTAEGPPSYRMTPRGGPDDPGSGRPLYKRRVATPKYRNFLVGQRSRSSPRHGRRRAWSPTRRTRLASVPVEAAGRASCGAAGGDGLDNRLRQEVAAERGRVYVAASVREHDQEPGRA